jgi:transposase
MISLPAGMKVYVANQALDMRKSFQGIASVIQGQFNRAPNTGHLFVFHNRSKDKVKIFYWDRNGFVQWYKQLEHGRFRFPSHTQKLYEISVSDLTLLLEGIDLVHCQRLAVF